MYRIVHFANDTGKQTHPFEWSHSTRSGCLSGPWVLNPQEARRDRGAERDKRSLGGPGPGCMARSLRWHLTRPHGLLPFLRAASQCGCRGFLSLPQGQSRVRLPACRGPGPLALPKGLPHKDSPGVRGKTEASRALMAEMDLGNRLSEVRWGRGRMSLNLHNLDAKWNIFCFNLCVKLLIQVIRYLECILT